MSDEQPPADGTADRPPPGGARPSLRQRLRDTSVRPSRGQLLAGLLLGLLGFALVVQVGSTEDADLSSLRQSDLVRILDDVTERSDRLRSEVVELETTRNELLTSTDRIEAARQQAQQRVDVLSVLAGTAPARGPGIRLTLRGSEIDARVVVDTVQELRDAGAEAIQLNDTRVVASTAFVDQRGGRLEVDGKEVEQPFVFLAIGDPQTLSTAMSFPDGVVERVQRSGTATVEMLDEVLIDALRSVRDPEYARPAEPSQATSSPTP